jgi:outer membrane protein OmpA-like peptidoglycan-associated protein
MKIPAAILLTGLVALPLAAQAPARVPLVNGLTIVTAVSEKLGDYESIKTIDAVTADTVHILYSAQTPNGQDAAGKPLVRNVAVTRVVRREDLKSAHEYMQTFNTAGPEVYPGTTSISASTAVLTDLKTTGATAFTFQTPGREPSMDKILGAFTGAGKGQQAPSLGDLAKSLDANKAAGTLKRVEAAAVAFPVLVNDQRVALSAIHAKGDFDGVAGEFYFLDDVDHPIVLSFDTGKVQGHLQVVRMSFPLDHTAPPQIEQALAKEGRAELHGIYFDFGRATLRPESDPVLQEIADALVKNPSWTVSVEGHTDNIGTDQTNLDLSKRRADAVRDALVTKYRVASSRLTTAGFGASRPKEPNTTLEGRARNRRVELVRK